MELMVVVAIAMILVAIAVPNFRDLIDRQRVSTYAADMYGGLVYARAEAIRRGQRVDLLPVVGTDWASGWAVSVPGPGGAAATVIYSHPTGPAGLAVTQALSQGNVASVAYDGTGRTMLVAAAATPVSGQWTLTINSQVRVLKINLLGRPSLCNPAVATTPPC
jgi:type IV fimbrial biogenesis protein FimT